MQCVASISRAKSVGKLIGQNRDQHPDLGFHDLSSHQAKAAQAGMAIPADDHMVVDGDAKQVANFGDLLGHVDVGPRWCGVAGRVVVHENAASGVQLDGSPQNLPRVHRRVVHSARPITLDTALRAGKL